MSGRLGDGSGSASPGLTESEPNTTSNVPPLSGDVDFGLITPDEEVDDSWTHIIYKMAHIHSLQPVLPVDNIKSMFGTICGTPTSKSTINQAEANMSSEQLMRMVKRHHFYTDGAIAAVQCKMSSTLPDKIVANKPTFQGPPMSPASGEGSSKEKGKGLNLHNTGTVPSLIDFTEEDFLAQKKRWLISKKSTMYSNKRA